LNTFQLSNSASEARHAFIAAVSAKAARFGITAQAVTDAQVQGEVLMVGGQAFLAAIGSARKALIAQVELLAFDEKLRRYADLRINLDLDDGVKVNYGKFGDLLAEVKSVTGRKAN
jgi:hypothetical protein